MKLLTRSGAAYRHLRHGAVIRKLRNRLLRSVGHRPQLLPEPGRGDRTDAARRINALLAAASGPTRYLEIGVQYGRTLEDVCASERWAVDPAPLFNTGVLPTGVRVFPIDSDAFFAQLDADVQFDVIFLDGLHEFRQTYRDLINASAHLTPHGLILVDDVIPKDRVAAIPDQAASLAARRAAGDSGGEWQGDVFKVIHALSAHHPTVNFRTIVRPGGAQSLVAIPRASRPLRPAAEQALAAQRALSYADAFGTSSPTWIRPMDEGAALEWALSAAAGTD